MHYYKKIVLSFFALLLTLPTWALEGENELGTFDWAVENIVLLMGGAVIIGTAFALYNSMKTIWMAQNISQLEANGMQHPKAVKQAKQQSFLRYIYQELAGVVPLEKEEDILLGHDYDGIRELDNNLPPWWVGMFYVSIIWAGAYILIYHFSDIGMNQIEEYEQELVDAEIAIASFNAKQDEEKANSVTIENVTALTDTDKLALGKETFDTYCVACHGKFGEGMEGLGQNLTDKYWIHGGGIQNIYKVVTNGVPGKTMVAWKTVLNSVEIQEVSSYILTLEGTNPPNAREPEGELWEE